MKMKNSATIQLETLTCPSCIQKIEGAVKNLEGIEKESVKVLFNASKLKVDFDGEKSSVLLCSATFSFLGRVACNFREGMDLYWL